MSVRAYRIIKKEYEQNPSFNLWHDDKLLEFLEQEGNESALNMDGVGSWDLPVEVIKKAIKNKKRLGLDEYHIEQLKKDIAEAKKSGDEYIEYYCF